MAFSKNRFRSETVFGTFAEAGGDCSHTQTIVFFFYKKHNEYIIVWKEREKEKDGNTNINQWKNEKLIIYMDKLNSK